MMRRLLIMIGAMATLVASPMVEAHEYKLGDLVIEHPWARASIGQVPNGAAYMTITISGQEIDHLVSVKSDVAQHVQLHTHMMEGDVAKMRPVEAIEIAPGTPTVLQPGGLHIMLMGLKAPLVEGQSFPLTLTFERAGEIEVEVKVEGAGAMEGDHDMEHGQDSSS